MKKIIIKQQDEADCGACSLQSIIKYYNGYVPLEIIRNDTFTNNKGTTFYNIKEAAINYGFEVKGLNIPLKDIDTFPVIAQEKIKDSLYHFVVIFEIKTNVIVMDPALGLKKYSKNEFLKLFTGNILILKPINRIVNYSKKNPFIKIIDNIIKINIKEFIMISILSLIIVLLSLLLTYGLKVFISKYSLNFLIIFSLLILLKLMVNYIKNIMVAHLNKKINTNLLSNYFKHIFNLSFKYLQLKKAGEITSRINDLNNIKSFFSKDIVNIIINLLFLIGSFAILTYLNKTLSLIIFLITFIYSIISVVLNKNIYNYYLEYLDSESNLYDYLIEYINKIITIKNLNKTNFFYNKIHNLTNANSDGLFKLEKKLNVIDLIIGFYSEASLILIIVFGLYLNINITNILVYILFYNYFSESIKYFMSLIPNLMYFKSAFNKISDLYYIPEESINNGLYYNKGDIIIKNLNYKINLNNIFNNLNIEIKMGNKVLIIGPNGCGKSTLLNMLYNYIDNYNGKITISNNNVLNINNSSLRDNICYIGQREELFIDTIINNIIIDREYNQRRLDIICNLVDLNSIISKKNYGINSLIDNNLSGGERQRIVLARALYRGFDILLLDEALSEVSHYLRLKIINNLNYFYGDKTIIFVSHNYEKYPFNQIINLTARKEFNVNR